MKKLTRYLPEVLYALLITLLFLSPYILKDLLPIEHDTFFHVSRIEQLSRSIREGNFLPALYPYENNGYGYASSLFYSDVLLIPAALLHIAGIPVSVCYKIAVGAASFFSVLAMTGLAEGITKKRSAGLLSGTAYLFANYHITDIYIRGAMGELFALMFLPVMLLGMYRILEEQDLKAWKVLAFGLSGLALSHNLTFLMGSILCAVIFCIELPKVDADNFTALFKGVFTAFLLTAFYTIPMIEQLRFQTFIVNYYAEHSDLASQSMDLWQYFANTTIFGTAGNYLEHDSTMLENVGYFLTFAPILWLLVPKAEKKKHSFVTVLMILGYICILLPSSLLPWDSMSFLRIMQFPWRFNTLGLLLLSVPAAYAVVLLLKKPILLAAVCGVLIAEGVWHVAPVLNRTFGITSGMTWTDVTDGALCNPYYSATYMRVELAGGDYLPLCSPDFRERSTSLKTADGTDLNVPYDKEGTSLTFTLSNDTAEEIVLPLTYYKGYTVYRITSEGKQKMNVRETSEGMVSFVTDGAGTYTCVYESTPLRKACIALSLLTLLLLLLSRFRKKNNFSIHE